MTPALIGGVDALVDRVLKFQWRDEKKGSSPMAAPHPALSGEAIDLERVKQLHTEGCLVAVGSAPAFLVNWVVSPILSQFGAAH